MSSARSQRESPLRKGLRRAFRRNAPTAERIIWGKLRNRQLMGYKFRRQHSFGRFVVDFYCKELNLVIEIDGDSHFMGDAERRDKLREEKIAKFGIRIIRFTNVDVRENLDGVLDDIAHTILQLRGEDVRESDPSP